jgi:hypothetical protein
VPRALQPGEREADGLAAGICQQRDVLPNVGRQLGQLVFELLGGIVRQRNLGAEFRVQLAQDPQVVVSRLADGDGGR